MGNCFESKSKPKGEESKQSSPPPVVAQPQKGGPKSWEIRRQTLKKEDYEIKNFEKQTIIKKPGSINGEQFVIENCKECDIYLCDYSAQIFIDDCDKCNIYIAPCSSSLFIRNCKSGKYVMSCQQFRMYNCENIDILLYTQTQPTIESSSGVRLGCFKFGYFDLGQQFKKAELNVWNNKWSEVHDFTKKATSSQLNYAYLDEKVQPYDLVPRISAHEEGNFSDPVYEDQLDSLVPITQGKRIKKYFDMCFIMLFPSFDEVAEQMIPIVNHHETIFFIQTKAVKCTKDQVQSLFNDVKIVDTLLSNKIKWGKEDFTFLQFGGMDVADTVTQILTNIFGTTKSYYIWKDIKSSSDPIKIVFEAWKEENSHEIKR
jgi:protein XRP2